jgi:glycosyltransferase involved in cell wall biosynthesis
VKVLYLIDSMTSGGAQRQLATLIGAIDRTAVVPHVAVYYPHDHFRPEIDRLGVPVHALGARGAKDPRVLVRLARLLRRERFDVVHSYLRTPGVLARVATLGCSSTKVVVSHRNVDVEHSAVRLLLERLLATRADAFIANAESVKDNLEAFVPASRGRVCVVPNGISWTEPGDDVLTEARRLRSEWGAGEWDLVLGVVGRVETQKDPHLLLDALLALPEELARRVSVIWVGAWIDRGLVASVRERLEAVDRPLCYRFVGETRAIRSVYLGIDCLVLPSRWEGFPNAVLEALAHAVPVIATDVGDARAIVDDGETGWIVSPEDADSLASAILALSELPAARRVEMGRKGAASVRGRYSVEKLVSRTVDVYRRVLGGSRDAP